MENVHIKSENGHYVITADKGFVITNYNDGEPIILFSKKIISTDGETKGYYTMPEKEAYRIKARLKRNNDEDDKEGE